jgi:hypothetical protein
MNVSFFELSDHERFSVYNAIESAECATHSSGSGLLSVAVAKGKFSELISKLSKFNLENTDLYKFPLGGDKPPMHLRHESYGLPDSAWMIAVFKVKQ